MVIDFHNKCSESTKYYQTNNPKVQKAMQTIVLSKLATQTSTNINLPNVADMSNKMA